MSENDIARIWPANMQVELAELDSLLQGFKEMRVNEPVWLKLLVNGLGLSMRTAGEMLGVKRQSFFELLRKEAGGDISIRKMKCFAEKIECHFVYGFVPKNHSTFAELIAQKALPFVEHPEIKVPMPNLALRLAMISRINKFLARPTGRAKIWGVKRALRSTYSWLDF